MLYHIMLCYVMLYYVILCYIIFLFFYFVFFSLFLELIRCRHNVVEDDAIDRFGQSISIVCSLPSHFQQFPKQKLKAQTNSKQKEANSE